MKLFLNLIVPVCFLVTVAVSSEMARRQRETYITSLRKYETKFNKLSADADEFNKTLFEERSQNQRLLEINNELFTELASYRKAAANPVYCISHNPLGGPWMLQRWWPEVQLWVTFAIYSSRVAAEDVLNQIKEGKIKEIDTFN